jgi:hypothetical protein
MEDGRWRGRNQKAESRDIFYLKLRDFIRDAVESVLTILDVSRVGSS